MRRFWDSRIAIESRLSGQPNFSSCYPTSSYENPLSVGLDEWFDRHSVAQTFDRRTKERQIRFTSIRSK
jgi:hypothetical protein